MFHRKNLAKLEADFRFFCVFTSTQSAGKLYIVNSLYSQKSVTLSWQPVVRAATVIKLTCSCSSAGRQQGFSLGEGSDPATARYTYGRVQQAAGHTASTQGRSDIAAVSFARGRDFTRLSPTSDLSSSGGG